MTKFTLTSKAKRTPLYYNMQVSVDKDCPANDFGSLLPSSIFYFYKDQPVIYTFGSENNWYLPGRQGEWIRTYTQGETITTCMWFTGIPGFKICDGQYPLPETISVLNDKNGVTITFTPIPVYE